MSTSLKKAQAAITEQSYENRSQKKMGPFNWTSINFSTNEWNFFDLSLKEAASLSSFKRNLSKVTLKVPVNK